MHLNYIDNKIKAQSTACTEIIDSLNNTESHENQKDDETDTIQRPAYDRKSLELNEWLRNSDSDVLIDNIDEDISGENFKSYVMHHLTSLTNFTKELYVRQEESKNLAESSGENCDYIVSQMLDEIKHLREECAEKNAIIKSLTKTETKETSSATQNSDWTLVPQYSKQTAERKPYNLENQIPLKNRYGSLAYPSRETECNESCIHTESNITEQTKPCIGSANSRRPGNVIDKKNENNEMLSWRSSIYQRAIPGNGRYSDISREGKKTLVLGDSVIKRMFGSNITRGLQHGKCFVRPYVGATCDEILYHGQADLNRGNVDNLVLVMGQNNVSDRKDSSGNFIAETADEITANMIDVALKLKKKYSINDVYLSTLTPRREYKCNEKVRTINNLLRMQYKSSGIGLIEHGNVTADHLADRVHLGTEGINVMTENIISALNKSF